MDNLNLEQRVALQLGELLLEVRRLEYDRDLLKHQLLEATASNKDTQDSIELNL